MGGIGQCHTGCAGGVVDRLANEEVECVLKRFDNRQFIRISICYNEFNLHGTVLT